MNFDLFFNCSSTLCSDDGESALATASILLSTFLFCTGGFCIFQSAPPLTVHCQETLPASQMTNVRTAPTRQAGRQTGSSSSYGLAFEAYSRHTIHVTDRVAQQVFEASSSSVSQPADGLSISTFDGRNSPKCQVEQKCSFLS